MSNSLILNSKEFNNKKTINYHSFKKNVFNLNEKSKLEKFKISKENKYNRKLFYYKSYVPDTDIGFYTKKKCSTNIDHVVSLKDAYDSGARFWKKSLKKKFANDKNNHVASCSRVNSSKGSSTPKDFLRKSYDGKGMEYTIVPFCSYLKIYYKIKLKYNLSFKNNDSLLFFKCDLLINNEK